MRDSRYSSTVMGRPANADHGIWAPLRRASTTTLAMSSRGGAVALLVLRIANAISDGGPHSPCGRVPLRGAGASVIGFSWYAAGGLYMARCMTT
jgi:hypothetical protein